MCNAIQERLIQERLVEDEVYEAMMRMRHRINDVLGMSTPNDGHTPQRTASDPDAPSRQRPPRGSSPEWEFVYGDGDVPEPKRTVGPIPTDVMAVGDVTRDPTAPIAPYIPPTKPQDSDNPFPMLNGPMG